MSTVKFKRNDVGREFEDTLGIDVTGTTIVFVMKSIADGTVFRIDCEIVEPTNGRIKVTITPDEIGQVVGTYQAEWEITFNDGDVLAVPEGSYHTVEVVPDLGEDSA